jgi:hypothetical protein
MWWGRRSRQRQERIIVTKRAKLMAKMAWKGRSQIAVTAYTLLAKVAEIQPDLA